MLLPIKLQKDDTQNTCGYQLKLPLNIDTIIPEDDSVRLLSQFVEAMDLTDLYSAYERINPVSHYNMYCKYGYEHSAIDILFEGLQ